MNREAREFVREADARDAARKAAPVAAALLDTLIEAQTAGAGDQEQIAVNVIRVSVILADRCEVTETDAETILRACGLWPAALTVGGLESKVSIGGIEFYRVQVSGAWLWAKAATPGTLSHMVLIDGREVARFAAKNDHHAANKARKLFGPDARTVLLPREVVPVADPFARLR